MTSLSLFLAKFPALGRHFMTALPYSAMPIYIVGALGAYLFPAMPGTFAVALLFNALMATPLIIGLLKSLGKWPTCKIVAVVSLFAYGIEGFGVAIGWPYGNFSYGYQLGPLLLDLVPWTLPLAYVPVAIGAYVAGQMLGQNGHVLIPLAIGTCLMVLFDLILDPGATQLGYWQWHDGGPFYGVPDLNFFGWIVSSVLVQWLIAFLNRPYQPKPGDQSMILWPFIWSVVFWTAIAAFSGRFGLIILGVSLAFLLIALCRGARVMLVKRS